MVVCWPCVLGSGKSAQDRKEATPLRLRPMGSLSCRMTKRARRRYVQCHSRGAESLPALIQAAKMSSGGKRRRSLCPCRDRRSVCFPTGLSRPNHSFDDGCITRVFAPLAFEKRMVAQVATSLLAFAPPVSQGREMDPVPGLRLHRTLLDQSRFY